MTYANLNRLVDLREQGVEPRGKRSQTGPTERSRPTGWAFKAGNATLQELEFSNGYVVAALQVEGQKAIIKGPEATMRLLDAIEKGFVQECYDAWLQHVSKGLGRIPESDASRAERGSQGHPVHRAPEASQEEGSAQESERAETEGRLEKVEGDIADIKTALSDIVTFMKAQPKQ